ncbi:MAG: hypothetical protein OEV94_05465 [Deltaproteobacteria bacterium]|nr:hypothetical protein [Deltaproteobacteria bacterium]
MRHRNPVSLFPFLSVLLNTMGILSFLAITFLMISKAQSSAHERPRPVKVRWVGAPEYVQPVLVECRKDRLVIHSPQGKPVQFSLDALRREARLVKTLEAEGMRQLGRGADRFQLWLVLKSMIQNESAFDHSFTRQLQDIELDNIRWRRSQGKESYPILLVFSDGTETYDLAAYLLETTSRLKVGLEPMLEGWEIPYRNLSG